MPPRHNRLDLWLRHDLPLRFEWRILGIDTSVADSWGQQTARSQAAGRAMGSMDAFLAATAEVHELTMVTRNVADFWLLGDTVINPWTA